MATATGSIGISDLTNVPEIRAVRKAHGAACRRRSELAALSRFRRLTASPRQAAITVLTAVLARIPRATFTVSARTFWGGRMRVVLPEVVSSEILRFGYVEENLVAALLAHVPAGGTVFDVGAHFGFFSLLASHLAGPEGRIVAFEPVPTTCSMLRRNVETAGVTIVNAAVWNEPTEVQIHDFGLGLSAFNSVRLPRLAKSARRPARERTVKVQAVTLDTYASENKVTPDFVKIDAESAEFEVLEGMERLLRDTRPVVSLEVGDLGVDGARPSADLVRHLTERGYRSLEYVDGAFREHRIRDRYAYGNLLFVPA